MVAGPSSLHVRAVWQRPRCAVCIGDSLPSVQLVFPNGSCAVELGRNFPLAGTSHVLSRCCVPFTPSWSPALPGASLIAQLPQGTQVPVSTSGFHDRTATLRACSSGLGGTQNAGHVHWAPVRLGRRELKCVGGSATRREFLLGSPEPQASKPFGRTGWTLSQGSLSPPVSRRP